MKILNKLLTAIIISTIALSFSVSFNEVYAAKKTIDIKTSVKKVITSAKEEKEAKLKKEKRAAEIKKLVEDAKKKHPELVAGSGMAHLNRSPAISFEKGKNGKAIARIEDGSGIEKIIRTNAKTKNKKEIAGNKQKEQTDLFDEPAKNKGKTIIYTLKDIRGLTSKVTCSVTNKGSYDNFNVSIRETFSYSNGYLNIILKDHGGIDEGKASVEVIDKNTNKSLGKVTNKNMKIKNPVKYDGKNIYGIYQIDINKLTRDKEKNYFIQVNTTDDSGNAGYRMAKFSLKDVELTRLGAKKQKEQEDKKQQKQKEQEEKKQQKAKEKEKAKKAKEKEKAKKAKEKKTFKKAIKAPLKVSNKKINKTISIGKYKATAYSNNGCHIAQAVTVSEKYYIATLCNDSKSRATIRVIDKNSGKVKRTLTSSYGHANGITYNNKAKKLYIAKLQGGKLAKITLDNLEKGKSGYQIRRLGNSVSGIAYDSYTNQYYTASGSYIRVYNSKFKRKKTIRKHKTGTPQDIGAYKGLILVIRKQGSNDYMDIYRNTGKYLGYYRIKTSGEVESVAYDEYENNFVFYVNYPKRNRGRIFTTNSIKLEDYVKVKK